MGTPTLLLLTSELAHTSSRSTTPTPPKAPPDQPMHPPETRHPTAARRHVRVDDRRAEDVLPGIRQASRAPGNSVCSFSPIGLHWGMHRSDRSVQMLEEYS